jgi:competence protein ComEA
MEQFMRLVFRLNTELLFALLALTPSLSFAQLPAGAGREETQKVCSTCHELERSVSLRQDRDGWKATINKMMGMGAQGTVEEFAATLEYLAAHYPANGLPPLNVNTAKAIDFEARLSLKRSESALIIKYRTEHGAFKSIEDLKKVPGVDTAKIDAKRDSLVY